MIVSDYGIELDLNGYPQMITGPPRRGIAPGKPQQTLPIKCLPIRRKLSAMDQDVVYASLLTDDLELAHSPDLK